VGYVIAIGRGSRLQPVAVVQDWLRAAGIASGPIFLQVHRSGSVQPGRLTAGMVALILKRRASLAGLDPVQLSGHSLRAGFITSAAENGVNLFKIADVSRHKSMDVMRGYVRSRDLFKDYAGDGTL
jgi:integrase